MYMPLHHVRVRRAENLKMIKQIYYFIMEKYTVRQITMSFSSAAKCTAQVYRSHFCGIKQNRGLRKDYVSRKNQKLFDEQSFVFFQ